MSPNEAFPEHKHSGAQPPDEETLAAAFARFQPRPSERFYERMASAPWQQEAQKKSVRGPDRIRSGLRLSWGMAAALVALVLFALLLASPPLRVTAKRFAQFFTRLDEDRTAIQVTAAGAGPLDYDFRLTLAQAERQAGFPIRQPATLPPSIQLNGVTYVPQIQTVILDYKTAGSNQIIRISQRKADNTESYAWIGASARVETVQIGQVTGEYVAGGWKLPEMADTLESAAPGMKVNLEAEWDPRARVQLLRWQADGMFYEILHIGATTPHPTDLDKAALIALAEAMR